MKATELKKRAIDTAPGRALYGQRIGTVEPVFGNLRHHKRLDHFTLRGRRKGNTSDTFTAWCTTSRRSQT